MMQLENQTWIGYSAGVDSANLLKQLGMAQLAWNIWLLQSYRKAEEFTNLRNCQCWAPLFLQDIKTDAPIAVDIRMEDLCLECNLQNVANA